jgi:hypothetical protein
MSLAKMIESNVRTLSGLYLSNLSIRQVLWIRSADAAELERWIAQEVRERVKQGASRPAYRHSKDEVVDVVDSKRLESAVKGQLEKVLLGVVQAVRSSEVFAEILKNVETFTEGTSQEYQNYVESHLSVREFVAWSRGVDWAGRKHAEPLRKLIDEVRRLENELGRYKRQGPQQPQKSVYRKQIDKLVLQRLLKKHRRTGKPNWTTVARNLPGHPDPDTVKRRAIDFGFYPE